MASSAQNLQEYCGASLIGVAVAFTILEIFIVALRFISRRLGNINLATDDILIVSALVFCIAINAVAIAMVQYSGVGYHLPAVHKDDPAKLVLWAKFTVVESCLYLLAVVLPKLAILIIYLRVFPVILVRIICFSLGGFMIAGSVVGIFFAGFGCRPFEYLWDKTIPGGYCVDIHALYMWASFPNILTDMVMLILPLPMVWKLQVTKNVKIGLTFTFLTGSIGLAASILRFYSFTTIDPLDDATWAAVILMIWTIVEPGAYILAACLPTLRPLVIRIWESSKQSLSRISASPASKRGSTNQLAGMGAAGMGIKRTISVAVHGQCIQLDHDYFELVEASSTLEKAI